MNTRHHCEICGQDIAATAYVIHMRKHVRDGEATVHPVTSHLFTEYVFRPTKRGETLQRDKKLGERSEAMNQATTRKANS